MEMCNVSVWLHFWSSDKILWTSSAEQTGKSKGFSFATVLSHTSNISLHIVLHIVNIQHKTTAPTNTWLTAVISSHLSHTHTLRHAASSNAITHVACCLKPYICNRTFAWHGRDLLGCCRLTGSTCWLTCSSYRRRRGTVGKGSFSPLPVAAGSHAKPAEYCM